MAESSHMTESSAKGFVWSSRFQVERSDLTERGPTKTLSGSWLDVASSDLIQRHKKVFVRSLSWKVMTWLRNV